MLIYCWYRKQTICLNLSVAYTVTTYLFIDWETAPWQDPTGMYEAYLCMYLLEGNLFIWVVCIWYKAELTMYAAPGRLLLDKAIRRVCCALIYTVQWIQSIHSKLTLKLTRETFNSINIENYHNSMLFQEYGQHWFKFSLEVVTLTSLRSAIWELFMHI